MRIVRKCSQILLYLRDRHFYSIFVCFCQEFSPFLLASNLLERRKCSPNPVVQLYLEGHFFSYFDGLSPVNFHWLHLQFKLRWILFHFSFKRYIFAILILLFLDCESLSIFAILPFRFMNLLLDSFKLFIYHFHTWVVMDVSLLLVLLCFLHNSDRHETLVKGVFRRISWVILLFARKVLVFLAHFIVSWWCKFLWSGRIFFEYRFIFRRIWEVIRSWAFLFILFFILVIFFKQNLSASQMFCRRMISIRISGVFLFVALQLIRLIIFSIVAMQGRLKRWKSS